MLSKCSVRASAAVLPDNGHMMTVQEAATLFGQSFEVSYLDNSGVYRTSSAVYQGSETIIDLNGFTDDAGYLVIGRDFLFYRMYDNAYGLNTQPQNITVRLKPQYSVFDTEYIYTAIAVLSAANDQSTSIAAYNSPVWSWIWNGNVVNFDSVSIAENDVLPHLNFSGKGSYSFDFVRAYMSSQGTTSGSSIEATFDHVRSWSSSADVFIMIGCPYISSGASGASGTIATTAATTATTAPAVDLGETNGLLGGIASAISNLFNKVTNIFNVLDDSSFVDDTAVIDSVPDSLDYDSALDDVDQIMIDADQILDDTPQIVSGIGFYFAIIEQLFTGRAVIFKLLIPVACLLSLLSILLWRE